jgi:hypothetical protein
MPGKQFAPPTFHATGSGSVSTDVMNQLSRSRTMENNLSIMHGAGKKRKMVRTKSKKVIKRRRQSKRKLLRKKTIKRSIMKKRSIKKRKTFRMKGGNMQMRGDMCNSMVGAGTIDNTNACGLTNLIKQNNVDSAYDGNGGSVVKLSELSN